MEFMIICRLSLQLCNYRLGCITRMILLSLYKNRENNNISDNYRYGQSHNHAPEQAIVLFAVISVLLFCVPALAGIKHISMHDVSSVDIKMLSVKFNLVEEDKSKSRLLVTLSNKQKEEVIIKHKRINYFMLEALVDPRLDLENAKINVYESKSGNWDKIYSTEFSLSIRNQANNNEVVHHQTIKPASLAVIKPEVRIASGAPEKRCYLHFDENESLWNMAKKYKNEWGTSIYGAVLAIYKTNLGQFKNKNINGLIYGKKLICPSENLIRSIGNSGLAREQFNRLVGNNG